MAINGYAPLPGSPPPASLMMVATNGTGGDITDTSESPVALIMGVVRSGGTLLLGFIRSLIAKFGWAMIATAIAATLGTAAVAKILAMLNDGSPDNAFIQGGSGGTNGQTIVKEWKANGWPFWMTSDGRIYTRTKNGVIKNWKPKKPIVMVRGKVTLAQAVTAQRYLDHLWRTVAKRTKALKLA